MTEVQAAAARPARNPASQGERTVTAYYNEIDPKAAAWLRELIKQGHIAHGVVDERSISDVKPNELVGFTQCHFFAGIGGWSLALRLAGWPDDRPVWTGSCPCQPFSAAGRRGGMSDERHLWPYWHHLINQCRPATVFGEQVASKDGLNWLDLVSADMEATGYAFAAADLCAAGVGAPHIRQRLWFVGMADSASTRLEGGGGSFLQRGDYGYVSDRSDGGLGHPSGTAGQRNAGTLFGAEAGEHGAWQPVDGGNPVGFEHAGTGMGGLEYPAGDGREPRRPEPSGRGIVGGRGDGGGGLADADSLGAQRWTGDNAEASGFSQGQRKPIDSAYVSERGGADHDGCGDVRGDGVSGHTARPSTLDSQWREADWLFCRDGKWRPVEPGTFPLAYGLPARVGRLRGYGNAIVPQVAAEIIKTVIDQ
jgi:DNA (cytosine-5)-methyltransferase 1